MISSPGSSSLMRRNGWVCVTRWPAKTALPSWPGTALPGQWPGPWSITVRVTPSKMGWTRPVLGVWISPALTAGTAAWGLSGGSTGAVRGAGEAGTVVDVGGSVVVVVSRPRVGASIAARATLGAADLTMATVEPPTTSTAVRVAMTRPRSVRASGSRAPSQASGRGRGRPGRPAGGPASGPGAGNASPSGTGGSPIAVA